MLIIIYSSYCSDCEDIIEHTITQMETGEGTVVCSKCNHTITYIEPV